MSGILRNTRVRTQSFADLTTDGRFSLLHRTPCVMAYIRSCKCWQLQKYVHLNPNDPHGFKVKGSLDSVIGDGIHLEDDLYHLGEVSSQVPSSRFFTASFDNKCLVLIMLGLVVFPSHYVDPNGGADPLMKNRLEFLLMDMCTRRLLVCCGITCTCQRLLTALVPEIPGVWVSDDTIRFYRMYSLHTYLEGELGGCWAARWPASYIAPEQHHFWSIPQGKKVFCAIF